MKKYEEEIVKEQNLNQQIQQQRQEITKLTTDKQGLNQEISALHQTDQKLNQTVALLEKNLTQEAAKEISLEETINATKQQVLDQMKKEDKHVAEMNSYIQDSQRSKIMLSKEMKQEIQKREASISEYKSFLANNITTFTKKEHELQMQLAESRQMIAEKKNDMVKLQQQLNLSEKSLSQIRSQKKSQDQKLIQQTTEEATLQKKIQHLAQVSTELVTVKNKLEKQMKLSQQKDEEIKQGEGLRKIVERKNAKLAENLDSSKIEVHKQNVEIEQKSKEINNLTNKLFVSQNYTQNVQHEILKLQQE